MSSMSRIRARSANASALLPDLKAFLAAAFSPDGPPRLDTVAREARCSVRTVQRRLRDAGLVRVDHPLWQAWTQTGERAVFTTQLSLAEQPWLADHRVFDRVLVPAAGSCERISLRGVNLVKPPLDS